MCYVPQRSRNAIPRQATKDQTHFPVKVNHAHLFVPFKKEKLQHYSFFLVSND